MPRNMSFAMTMPQIIDRSKTVTRRVGWWFLKPGDVVNAVKKAMGLKKGEKVEHLTQIRVVSVRGERPDAITQDDCRLEGFPDLTPAGFVEMLCQHNRGCTPATIANRIEFEYVDTP